MDHLRGSGGGGVRGGLLASGTGLRSARYACPRLTLFATSGSRALRKFPDGNFRRPLVGSLRACSSAEMVAPICNMAARTGFLLAALHSVAKRVSRGQAYHPRWSPSPLARRPSRTPPPPHHQQLRSPSIASEARAPRLSGRSQASGLAALATTIESRDSSPQQR